MIATVAMVALVDMVDMVDMEKGRRHSYQTPRAKSRGKRYRLWRVLDVCLGFHDATFLMGK